MQQLQNACQISHPQFPTLMVHQWRESRKEIDILPVEAVVQNPYQSVRQPQELSFPRLILQIRMIY